MGIPDVSALGAAYMAGLKIGVYKNIEHLKTLNSNKSFVHPADNAKVIDWYKGWRENIRSKTGKMFIESASES
jgi:glycerol kinase